MRQAASNAQRLSRGHRVNNGTWIPRVGHDAAECLWRSLLYQAGAVSGLIVFVLAVPLLGRLWFLAYVEATIPVGCMLWSLVEVHRFKERSAKAVGVFVGWRNSIPSDEQGYLRSYAGVRRTV